MGTTRKYCLHAWHCVTSPCKSCKKPSVKRYSARSRRAFFLSRAPQCGQMNSTVSCCGSRSRAAQPVRRTPTVSGLCRSIGAFLLRSTSTSNKMQQSVGRIRCPVTYLFTKTSRYFESAESIYQLPKAAFPNGGGNLSEGLVSNAVRTRATSHPCERGVGLLEI